LAKSSENWMKALDGAITPDEVLELVDDFIASRSDVYWTGVPPKLRSPAITGENDLGRWHHDLVRAISDMPSPGTPMQELCVFSLRASVRFHQIRLRQSRGGGSNENEFSAAPARRNR
jgi:hypothetical protein